MDYLSQIASTAVTNWTVWVVAIVLIVAAIIDGIQLKVPNWITFPFVLTGLAVSFMLGGWPGLGWGLVGMIIGLALLLPAYAIGGMGAGDVKLLAGVGAWMHGTVTFYAFCVSVVVGAVMAICMVLWRRGWKKHSSQFMSIFMEIITIKDPNELSQIAAARKSTMLLLPYGIPIAIGTIGYFLWMGMLL